MCIVLNGDLHIRDHMHCRGLDLHESAETTCNGRTKVNRSEGGICEIRESKY